MWQIVLFPDIRYLIFARSKIFDSVRTANTLFDAFFEILDWMFTNKDALSREI